MALGASSAIPLQGKVLHFSIFGRGSAVIDITGVDLTEVGYEEAQQAAA
jgi:hypothetical protein